VGKVPERTAVCFCGLDHTNYQSDLHALLSDAYHDIFQGAPPGKEWQESTFDLLSTYTTNEVEITSDMCLGEDELYVDWYKCPQCGDDNIMARFQYCPGCGTHLKFV